MVTGSDFNARIIREFRANKGKIGGEFEGGNFLLLHTIARRTDHKRLTPMAYIPDGDRLLVVAAKPVEQGTPNDPAWYRNLMAHPETTIEIGSDTRCVTAAMVGPNDQEAAWESVIAAIPFFSAYRTNPHRHVPLVALTMTE